MAFNRNAPKINRPYVARLDNAKYSQMIAEVVRVTNEIGSTALKIDKYYDAVFLVLVAELQKAFKKMNLSTFTKLLNDADSSRDDAIYALIAVLKACLRSKNEEIRLAAQRLLDKLNSYGNLAEKGLDAQSASTNDLLASYEEDFSDEITTAGVKRWVDDVKDTNAAFEDLMVQRYKESENKPDVKVREVRKELDEALKYVCSMTEVLAITDGDEIYTKYIKSLNVVFARFGSRRSASAGDSDNNNTNPTTPTEPYPNAREWSADIDYQTCASGDIFYIVRNGVKEYYKLLDFGEVATFEPGMDDGGIWEKIS